MDVAYAPDVEAHFQWVKDNSVLGTCGDKSKPFLPSPLLKSRFQEDGHGQLRRLLRAVKVDVSRAQSIAQSYCAVFEILLHIKHPTFIEYFIERGITDSKLPLTRDVNLPESAGPGFYKQFTDEQWRYCVEHLSLDFRHFEEDTILPFVKEDKPFNEKGSSAKIYRIETCEGYRLQDTTRTLALKAYFGTDAATNCRTEEKAYNTLKSINAGPAVIEFFGCFRHGDRYYTVLEYADGGSLEDLFQKQEPKLPAEILTFYDRLLELCTAIMYIVNIQEPENTEHIWHQDIKPENILVVSSKTSKNTDDFPWEFKLADFGASHFRKLPFYRDRDSRGSATYGSPECYRSDCKVLRLNFNVTPKVDVWSLGAVFSEAVAWVVFGTPGLERYRLERTRETKALWKFQDDDCFHNGNDRLDTVDRFLHEAKRSSRTSDLATKLIADLVLTSLLVSEDHRLTAHQLHGHGKRILDEARTSSPSRITYSQRLTDFAPWPRNKDNMETDVTRNATNGQLISPGGSIPSPSDVSPRQESIVLLNDVSSNLTSDYSIPRLEISPGNNQPSQPGAEQNVPGDNADSSIIHSTKPDPTRLSTSTEHRNVRNSGESSSPRSSGQHLSNRSQGKEGHESSEHLRQLTLDQVYEWYNRVKASNSKLPFRRSKSSIPGLEDSDLISHQRGMDHVFLIDDATSMRDHWSNVQRLFRPLVYLIKFHKLDKDGQDLHFATSDKRLMKQKNTKKLIKTVMGMTISNVESDLPGRLAELLHKYQQKLNESTTGKGLQIYVLTDGKWQNRSDDAAESCIKSLVETLDQTRQPQKKVGIQFIRFGDDPEGKARLDRLDRLKKDNPNVTRDIADTERFDGNIWKILVGATNDTYDNDYDARAE